MKLRWREVAQGHVLEIARYIARDKQSAAKKWAERIYKRAKDAARFPYMGKRVEEKDQDNVRELVEGAYRIIYVIDEAADLVEIYMIVHGARLLENAEREVRESRK